jgi:hypothetical protein
MTGRDWVFLVTGAIAGAAAVYTWQDIAFWYKQYKLRKYAKKGDSK